MTLTLYGHAFSSYTWKAQIAFYANETPFDFHQVDPRDPGDAEFLRKVHPFGKFPVLTDGDTTIIESSAIIEYLAAAYPGRAPLIPADRLEAITVRTLDRLFDNYVMASMQRVVNAYLADRDNPDPAEVEGGKADLKRVYAWLETWLEVNRFPPHVSLASCAAAPSLFYADWVERLPEGSRLAALRAELLALPAVNRCIEEARPYRAYFPPGAPDRD